jgi:hypothetical protein
MSKIDYKINRFREKYEQDLRKLVTQGCCVASCTNDGLTEQEEIEMNEFTKLVISLVDRAHRSRTRTTSQNTSSGTKIISLLPNV